MAELLLTVVRGAVALSCGAFAIVALTHWASRRGAISPFGAWTRNVRRLAEPAIKPVERRVVARGGNPQDAPYWLLGALVLGGLVLISLTQWVLGYLWTAWSAVGSGPGGTIRFIGISACELLSLALLVRAMGSWFGIGRFTPWMRPLYVLTDWMVRPLQRVIPPVGMFDLTPLVALVLLALLRGLFF